MLAGFLASAGSAASASGSTRPVAFVGQCPRNTRCPSLLHSRFRRARRNGGAGGLKAAAGDGESAVLAFNDLTLSAGTRDLLTIESAAVTAGLVVGIVGPNGAGKSTLLRAIAAADEYPRAIRVAKKATVGYLPQQAVSGSQETVWNEARSEMKALLAAERRIEAATAAIDDSPESITAYERAMEEYRVVGGYEQDEKIGRVLTGLGFSKDDWAMNSSEMSGGWQMRIALARLLLQEPTVLLLDEPTNHLDTSAKKFLRSFINEYPHTIVLVSHDIGILDGACTRIYEIEDGQFIDYPGCNYSKYLVEKETRSFSAQRAAEKKAVEVEKLQSFIDRFGAKATKASQAQSKQKALDKLLGEGPDLGSESVTTTTSKMRIRLPKAPACAREAIHLENADIGYPDSEVLIRNVSLTLERGCRYAVVGLNGCGKSTLMKTLSGALECHKGQGTRRLGDERVSIGVFTQDLAALLPHNKTGLEYMEGIAPNLFREKIRATLGALGIRDNAALRQIGQLSGGEQARVALASFVVESHNVLFCDEISNHLDLGSVDVLCDALESFTGCLLLVTHDRRLLERVATHTIVVEDQKATVYHGIPRRALSIVAEQDHDLVPSLVGSRDTLQAPDASEQKAAAAVAYQKRKDEQKALSKARKRLPVVEGEIESLEERLPAIEADLMKTGSDVEKAIILQSKMDEISDRIQALYEEYETLETCVSQAKT